MLLEVARQKLSSCTSAKRLSTQNSIKIERNRLSYHSCSFIPNDEYLQRPYEVRHSASNHEDEHHWKAFVQRWLTPCLTILSFLVRYHHLQSRYYSLQNAQSIHNKTFSYALAFLALQIYELVPNLIIKLWRVTAAPKRRVRPKLRLEGSHMPTVDVVVVSCGEDPDIIINTVRAACVIDYPAERFRVVLSDDAGDDRLRTATNELGHVYGNVFYNARHKLPGVPHGFKAGNIHSAIRYATTVNSRAAEWVAVLDCDMIPERDMLRTLLAYGANDSRVGMVSAPQRFYNIPVNDPLCQDVGHMADDDDVLRDSIGAAWCTGSGFVVRRRALDDIGGFSQTSLSEDTLCGLMLHGRGWQVVHAHEDLQWGLMPDNITGHLRQRTKWSVGNLQNSLILQLGFSSKLRHADSSNYLVALTYFIKTWSDILVKLPMLCLVPCVGLASIMAGQPLIVTSSTKELRGLLHSYLVCHIIERLYDIAASTPIGYRARLRQEDGELYILPTVTLAQVVELLPVWLGGRKLGFTPTNATPKQPDTKAEALLCLASSVLVYGFASCMQIAMSPESLWKILLTTILWPDINFGRYLAFLIPIFHALRTPKGQNWKALTVEDNCTGVRRPKATAKKQQWDFRIWLYELPRALATLRAVHALWTMR